MPRSTQQIIDQAEELSRSFEEHEPGPDDERPAEAVEAIRRAALQRSFAERQVQEAVKRARKDGLSWAMVGAALGTSGEAARQRYS